MVLLFWPQREKYPTAILLFTTSSYGPATVLLLKPFYGPAPFNTSSSYSDAVCIVMNLDHERIKGNRELSEEIRF